MRSEGGDTAAAGGGELRAALPCGCFVEASPPRPLLTASLAAGVVAAAAAVGGAPLVVRLLRLLTGSSAVAAGLAAAAPAPAALPAAGGGDVAARRHCAQAQAVTAATMSSNATPQPTAMATMTLVLNCGAGVAVAAGTTEHDELHGTPLTAAVALSDAGTAGVPAAVSAASIDGSAALGALVMLARPAVMLARCAVEAAAGTSTVEV